MAAAKRRIAIDGDVTVDWMFMNPGGDLEGVDFPEIWGAGFQCGACARPGGAAVPTNLVSALTRSDPALFGPNPHGPDDVAYMLRRALLLRSLVAARSPRLLRDGILQIDEGVLRAFACADRFRQGARSMQAIVETSSLSGKLHYDRSSLSPEDQLDLHVDGRLFGDQVEGGS